MASYEDVEQALMDGIKRLADKAAEQNAASYALKLAAAANQLAEARAWLHSSSQPHGGSSFAESS